MRIDLIDIKIALLRLRIKLRQIKILPFIIIGVILLLFGASYFLIDIRLIGDQDYELCIYENYFDNGCRSKFLFLDLDNKIVSNNINNEEFGDYQIVYETRFLCFKKEVVRNIHVIDDKKPSIVLNGNDTYYLSLNEEFIEPGYSVSDNYDVDLNNKVTILGSVDTSKEGTYEITYEVSDSSGNLGSTKRTVIVKENNYLSLPVSEFWLADIFPEVIIEPQDEEIDYFDEVVLLGDSNTWFLYKYSNLIKAEQCWGKRNLTMTEINSSVFENFVDGENRTLAESIETFSPKYLIISPGIGSPLFMNDTARYVEELKTLIEYLQNEHPEITFVFSAILPINEGQLTKEFQERINIYNYYLAEICYNYKVKIINFSDTIRGEDGYGISSKFVYSDTNVDDRGFHLSVSTRIDYVDYLKHCDIRGE